MNEPRVPTFWLSMHTPYACRHSGACCSSSWPIPVEQDRVRAIQFLRDDRTWLVPQPGAPSDVAGVLAYGHDGQCVFHRHGCEIQRAYGHGALPAACQHFPREVLLDPRGVFVTLSHYCPTAADLLFAHRGPVAIVEGPPAVPGGIPEGLDARDVLPPLLNDHILMDHAGYSAWESQMVRILTSRDDRSPEQALALLDAQALRLQRWRPGSISLATAIADLGDDDGLEIGTSVFPNALFPVVNRFLAAHAFASWMAYQGSGLPSVLRGLHLTLATLTKKVETIIGGSNSSLDAASLKNAIRDTDLQLVHLVDRNDLARRLAGWA